MENKQIKLIKYLDINNQELAIGLYKNMKQAYLELRLSSKHSEIKNYVGQKKIIKKNMARALTYLSQSSLDNIIRKAEVKYEK
jgi:ribosomal protein L29